MKLKFWLGLSILLNVIALGALLFFRTRSLQDSSPTTTLMPAAAPQFDSNSARPKQVAKAGASSTTDWVQALRAARVPEKLIADVAAAEFQEDWDRRSWANQRRFERGEMDQDALTKFDLQHDVEQEKELRAVLGNDGFRHWDKRRVLAEFDRAGLELVESESDDLYDLRKTRDGKRLALDQAVQEGKVDENEARQRTEALDAQYNEQLLKLLGVDRYALVQSGGDTGLGELRRNLRALNADDGQVSGMESAQQSWNEQRNKLEVELQAGRVSGEDYEKQLKALESARDQEYQKVLGGDRYAEFQRNQDERYQTMKRVGTASGLTETDVNELYSTVQNYENAIRDYRDRAQGIEAQGQQVDWAAVEKTLRGYSDQTENALRASLGDKFDKLKRSNALPFER